MTEFREVLQREAERFDLPPGALDRLHRKQRRRQRNRRMVSGAVALIVALGGTLLAIRAFGDVDRTHRPAQEPRIVETWSIDARPNDVAVADGTLWIASEVDRAVLRVDAATGAVERIPIPADVGPPVGVSVGMGSVWAKTAWVDPRPRDDPEFLGTSPAILRIDPATNRVLSTIPLEHDAHPRVTFGAGALWSAVSGTGTVSRRELPEGELTATAPGPPRPVALAFGEEAVWSLGQGRDDVDPPIPGTLARIDPSEAEVIASAEVGLKPLDLALGEEAAWIVSAREQAVIRVDAETVSITDRIEILGAPSRITVGETAVWVLEMSGGTLVRLDPAEGVVTGSVDVGTGALAMATAGDRVWVVRGDGTILAVDG
jgi:DNA-binding beta-propeller fold protein YncE